MSKALQNDIITFTPLHPIPHYPSASSSNAIITNLVVGAQIWWYKIEIGNNVS